MSHYLKGRGYQVTAVDLLLWCSDVARAAVENDSVRLDADDVAFLLRPASREPGFVEQNYVGLYFDRPDSQSIDRIRARCDLLPRYKRSLALASLYRSCLKKRPRGVFSYVGLPPSDGRRDLRLSIDQHFVESVGAWNLAVRRSVSGSCRSVVGDILEVDVEPPDIVFCDPPYLTQQSRDEYGHRYHFLEGLADYWATLDVQWETRTRKVLPPRSQFTWKPHALEAARGLIRRFVDSAFVWYCPADGFPGVMELYETFRQFGKNATVVSSPRWSSLGRLRATRPATVHEALIVAP